MTITVVSGSAPIPRETAERVFAVIAEECGARTGSLGQGAEAFVRYVGSASAFRQEFRFGGALGFGGKFYNDGGRWRVGCYPEDSTLKREAMIARANERLAALRAETAR